MDAGDGQIVGWRVLCKGIHLVSTGRQAALIPGMGAEGLRGAFGFTLQKHPELGAILVDHILRKPGAGKFQESAVNMAGLHRMFLVECRKCGIGPLEYPFTTKSQGLPALREYRAKVLLANASRAAALLGGQGAGKRTKLANGHMPLLAPFTRFSAVAMDAHTIDAMGTVFFPGTVGGMWVPIQRLVILVIVERSTWAILGYSIALGGGGGSAEDAITAVRHALSVWHPMQREASGVRYAKGAGFPSGCIPELAGAVWSTLYLDNASNFTSVPICERLRRRLGCAINYGPVADWTRRFWVEGTFSALERGGFQRLPNTTGAHPMDVRRRKAEQEAVAMKYEWDDLVYNIDVALANENATPRERLYGSSSLEALSLEVNGPQANFIPRRLPPLAPGQADFDVHVLYPTVRGNLAQGRNPYIEYLGVHYTSAALAGCYELIGKRLCVHVHRDLRTVKAFLENGTSLGVLTAGEGWSTVPHDAAIRREVKERVTSSALRREADEDWVQALLRQKAQEAIQQQINHHHKPKVSRPATEVAKLAHATGLAIPETSTEAAPAPARSRAPKKARALPSFVKPWSRTTDY
jgi:hypothetical protein